jgi:NRAMP (natural resistance-associated macrophage protein)-like metal ion transporter
MPTPNRLRRFLRALGPGLITGASDDDPAGIATYAMVGARFGYALLWTAWVTFPLMAAVQFTCAKIGLVKGCGIAGILRQRFPRPLAIGIVFALLIANTINAGADLVAIAAGINLLAPLPISMVIAPIALLILVVQIWGSYRFIEMTFKWLALSLLAYIGSGLLADPDQRQVLRGTLIPTLQLDREYLLALVAVLGTTISPYLFFWQANQEVESIASRSERPLQERSAAASDDELHYSLWDVIIGMFASNVVMYFIILATAATRAGFETTEITTAAEAAEALRPVAGNLATVLMALGLIGTGVLTVPVLTSSGAYAVCEMFGWRCSLDAKPGRAKEFYLVLAAATIGGLAINFMGVSPMDALFWSAVINGFLTPPLLILIVVDPKNWTTD